MANTTSFQKRRRHRGGASNAPAPERIRPLKFKTAMRLAFERAFVAAGVSPEVVSNMKAGGIRTTATWKGTRAA